MTKPEQGRAESGDSHNLESERVPTDAESYLGLCPSSVTKVTVAFNCIHIYVLSPTKSERLIP